jgi:hypothetical protein
MFRPKRLPNAGGQIQLAYKLSNGRIIEEPGFLLCTEVLRVPFPSELVPPASDVLVRYMDVVCRGKSLAEIWKVASHTRED